jgi:hypothetical protein
MTGDRKRAVLFSINDCPARIGFAENDPAIIFISGWNDWQYGCQIEPAVEYRFLYLDIAAKTLGRWAEMKRFRDE